MHLPRCRYRLTLPHSLHALYRPCSCVAHLVQCCSRHVAYRELHEVSIQQHLLVATMHTLCVTTICVTTICVTTICGAVCSYYHRKLNVPKLLACGFAKLAAGRSEAGVLCPTDFDCSCIRVVTPSISLPVFRITPHHVVASACSAKAWLAEALSV